MYAIRSYYGSLSISCSGMAAILMAMKGPADLWLSAWMALDRCSLPTPVSPSSSMVASLDTTCRVSSRNTCISRLLEAKSFSRGRKSYNFV